MKPLNLSYSSAMQTFHRRSADFCAIAFLKNRAEICAPTALAALLLASTAPASADTLGRLFFTPEQRIHLDYDYARNAPTGGNSSPFFTVNGIVQKHGGPRTVWINGMSQNADSNGERNPTAQTVSVPGKSRPVKLKVGDKILLDQPATSTQDTATE